MWGESASRYRGGHGGLLAPALENSIWAYTSVLGVPHEWDVNAIKLIPELEALLCTIPPKTRPLFLHGALQSRLLSRQRPPCHLMPLLRLKQNLSRQIIATCGRCQWNSDELLRDDPAWCLSSFAGGPRASWTTDVISPDGTSSGERECSSLLGRRLGTIQVGSNISTGIIEPRPRAIAILTRPPEVAANHVSPLHGTLFQTSLRH